MCIRDRKVDGAIQQEIDARVHIPRDSNDDYGPAAIRKRQEFITEYTGTKLEHCLLYTSDAADERSREDLGGRRIIKKKNNTYKQVMDTVTSKQEQQKKLMTWANQ